MRKARDKFIAHLDDLPTEDTPHMNIAKNAVHFYHRYILRNEAQPEDLTGLPTDLIDYYSACYDEAKAVYARRVI